VIDAVPDCPPIVAVSLAVPTATAVTRPVPDTVATDAGPMAQVTARPVSTFPLASYAVAVSCAVWPGVRFDVAGVTDTDATAASLAVTVADPVLPPLVAVIVALPAATAVTTPLLETETTPLLLLAQVIARPARTSPLASLSVAVSWAVLPMVRLVDDGVTVTDATGAGDEAATVTLDVPLIPSLVAVMIAAPTATAVTIPLEDTVAMLVFDDAHVTTRPVS
jgi:hypothetical protein